jgi:D-beta-D-heptose 7-phosphate kinase/D-beta-D-heptose 1-phosphate adenosyltransferase
VVGHGVCVSGGFDPLHIGHLEMFRDAAQHGALTVILNSDAWLMRKKGFVFLPFAQRAAIIGDLRYVAHVAQVDDADNTVCEALTRLKPRFFANGGDRKPGNTPEMDLCNQHGIGLLWNIGGGKSDSSSDIARKAWVTRDWGRYATLDEGKGYKVKRVELNPGKAISLQYHNHRSEYWYMTGAGARIQLENQLFDVQPHTPPVQVERGMRHRLGNTGSAPLVVIEIQSGHDLSEDDIIRLGSSDMPPMYKE